MLPDLDSWSRSSLGLLGQVVLLKPFPPRYFSASCSQPHRRVQERVEVLTHGFSRQNDRRAALPLIGPATDFAIDILHSLPSVPLLGVGQADSDKTELLPSIEGPIMSIISTRTSTKLRFSALRPLKAPLSEAGCCISGSVRLSVVLSLIILSVPRQKSGATREWLFSSFLKVGFVPKMHSP